MAVTVVTDDAALADLLARVGGAPAYALDTEFHREKTYWPELALVQVAWPAREDDPGGLALIDPQAVDLAPFGSVLSGPGTMVAHAAEQDLEVLELACGSRPSRLWDTQIAAGFLGHASTSLSSLSASFLGIHVAKGDRLTDWSRRPLTDSQLAYAAADVEHLIALADTIRAELDALGRVEWAEEECELLRTRPSRSADPSRAWWKLRDARQLRGPARGVAQEVAAWREQRAQALDQPVRLVLPDLALQSIAHQPPRTPDALAKVRGLDGRHLRGDAVTGVLEAIERGRRLPEDAVVIPPTDDVARELRPAIALAMAWIAQLARNQRVDASLLATRGDVVSFLLHEPRARLATGWRAALAGEPLERLVSGQAALAFDGKGSLVLEDRIPQG